MPITPEELFAEASCFSCYGASQVDLLKLTLLSRIAESSGTGGAGITCANYAGGEPTFTPTTSCAVAIDTSTERIWWYYSGAWH